MDPVWESLHSNGGWGKYPAEDLIRTLMRRYKRHPALEQVSVLEIGCGAGANLSFLLKEGFKVSGIDGAPSAIKTASQRLSPFSNTPDLRVGNFVNLPWENQTQDVVVDYFAVYANQWADIEKTVNEVLRVLKPGGAFYSRSWGVGTEGDSAGVLLEPGTIENPHSGPCCNMGVSHFFDYDELLKLFGGFSKVDVRRVTTESMDADGVVVEWVVWAEK